MKSYRSIVSVASLVLAAAFTVGTAQASGPKRLSGVIVGVDRDARTIRVRSDLTKKVSTVFVPQGKMVTLSSFGNTANAPSAINFEFARRGVHVNLAVESANSVALK